MIFLMPSEIKNNSFITEYWNEIIKGISLYSLANSVSTGSQIKQSQCFLYKDKQTPLQTMNCYMDYNNFQLDMKHKRVYAEVHILYNCNVIFGRQLKSRSVTFSRESLEQLFLGHDWHKLITLDLPFPVNHIHSSFISSPHHDLVKHSEAMLSSWGLSRRKMLWGQERLCWNQFLGEKVARESGKRIANLITKYDRHCLAI